jgi:hypothetical protein
VLAPDLYIELTTSDCRPLGIFALPQSICPKSPSTETLPSAMFVALIAPTLVRSSLAPTFAAVMLIDVPSASLMKVFRSTETSCQVELTGVAAVRCRRKSEGVVPLVNVKI